MCRHPCDATFWENYGLSCLDKVSKLATLNKFGMTKKNIFDIINALRTSVISIVPTHVPAPVNIYGQ